MIDLSSMPSEEIADLGRALRAEGDKRRNIAVLSRGISEYVDQLHDIGAALPVITRTATTVMPEYGWLPGQRIQQGGRLWENTSGRVITVPPGQQITPWTEVPPEPKPKPEPSNPIEGEK